MLKINAATAATITYRKQQEELAVAYQQIRNAAEKGLTHVELGKTTTINAIGELRGDEFVVETNGGTVVVCWGHLIKSRASSDG